MMQTLQELVDAHNAGEITDVVAVVDNDHVSFWSESRDEQVLALHPSEVIEQALTALNIPTQPV